MQCLIPIILFTLTTNVSDTVEPKKVINEKREYAVETANGFALRKLKMTTTYSIEGNILSEVEACNDSNCCDDNKRFRLHKNKNEYWYKDGRLFLRVFKTCDSMPSYKDFHSYKFDNKKRLIEEEERTFSYETTTQKYENGNWILAKVGDSSLSEINVHQYIYNQFDSVIEEKIIIQRAIGDTVSWKVGYQYDNNRNLVKIEQPGLTGNVSEIRYYDDKNRVKKIKSNLTEDDVTVDISYDRNGNVSSVREAINDKIVTTKYKYNNSELLLSEESEGNKIQSTTTKYFYNEFNDLVRKETSYGNKAPFITEFEYTYH